MQGQIEEVLGLYLDQAIQNNLELPVVVQDQPLSIPVVSHKMHSQGAVSLAFKSDGAYQMTLIEALVNPYVAKAAFGENPINAGVKQLGKRKEAQLPAWKYYMQSMSTMDLKEKAKFLQGYFKQQARA